MMNITLCEARTLNNNNNQNKASNGSNTGPSRDKISHFFFTISKTFLFQLGFLGKHPVPHNSGRILPTKVLARHNSSLYIYHFSTVVDVSSENTVVLLDTGTPGSSE